ncbi:DsbE family thiol:disulfide interchange protein [Stenotrophomonas sp. MMGLT7]|uniref:DsbE family thiol:disulfide interchange protein n=1 Tax=Stenotrophomonas sp. MMGLT7 TaxID=2901227 RepID=UPI001E652AC9|nr:DsbE family thiol:disulfide interchange protein [Stenotrophomonas sp. MMGLT7]MCD7097294.1 DsbE family thiol:disulfide interchange protein [Stenotrophomonas sp. MMGLT7]
MSTPSPRRLSRTALVAGAVALLALLVLLAWGVLRSGRPDRDALPSPLIGKPAPEFALPLLHDPSITVHASDLRGAPYVLNVWGSWCPACRDEHPVLSRFALTKRVRVIGYNWKDERADALDWLEKLGNPYILVVADQDGRSAIDWGITAAPETFLVDAQGIVRWKYSGAVTDEIIERQLLPALAKAEHDAGIVPHRAAPQ